MKMFSSLRYAKEKGFALISALMIMTLLTVLAFAMMSLSNSTTRSTNITDAMEEAKANARMALMMAIGELQEQMGPDQRISANGSILSDSGINHPMWTGVWDSWKAGDSSTGSVDGFSHHSTIGDASISGMSPTYLPNRSDHFRSWLISLNPDEASSITSARDLVLDGVTTPSSIDTAVLLVGSGSLGTSDPADYVSARLLPMISLSSSMPSGRYGWWVGDESQKARIMSDSYERESSLSLAQKIARTQSPAATGTKTITNLESITVAQEQKLEALSSMNTLDVLMGNPIVNPSKVNFHTITPYSKGVIADVREGGLKRDLSTILERNIDPNEVYDLETPTGLEEEFKRATATTSDGDNFMLYSFDDMVQSTRGQTGEASVPIQDLAAYYQMYDHSRPGGSGGIQFTSNQSSPSNNLLTGGIMVSNPDYGILTTDRNKYLRNTSALYRSVYPIKIEFVLSYITEPRPQADIDRDLAGNPAAVPPIPPNPDPDTHRLKVGITPSMTFWNPSNVPVVMNLGNPEHCSIFIRKIAAPLALTLQKRASANGPVVSSAPPIQLTRLTRTQQGELYTLFVSGSTPIIFQPGETKVLALKFSSQTLPDEGNPSLDFYVRGTGYRFNEPYVPLLELIPGWNPERFIRPTNRPGVNVATYGYMNFKTTDYISAAVGGGTGLAFNVDFAPKSRHGRPALTPGVMWHYRTYSIRMRMFPGGNPNSAIWSPFRNAFFAAGILPTTGTAILNTVMSTINIPSRSGQTLVDSMQDPADFFDDLPQAFFYYALKASTETHELRNAFPSSGRGAARRFPARPFLHSTVMRPQIIDSITGPSLYNTGWNWAFTPINNLIDAPISISAGNQGYYGGGYTAENGTTHVVQQELPVIPPISIAALSHAQLSGYSLSSEAAAGGYWGLQAGGNPPRMHSEESFRRTTAIGFGGLEPRTLQAIGNSYAHPHIPKDKAITTLGRVYFQNTVTPSPTPVPYADHSYLANKALWDNYFFSSITPVPADNPVFNESAKTVDEITRGFFAETRKLLNRRMVPYAGNLNETKLDTILTEYSQYENGFADKIAANMMVEGPFNVNSTSEAAWKTVFSSLKGKAVTHLPLAASVSGSIATTEQAVTGVPVGSGFLSNERPYTGSSSDPSDPEQWTGSRELTDDEIDELAKAMVKQVRLRGPFLSMSDFVNRRLDSNPANTALSVMGALQAAIDDPDCSINEGFRDDLRKFSANEITFAGAVFPEAMNGAVAYGSAAYVDQADILRNMAEQLTPRGDTFVIRAYGDSLDANGDVVARAWCEAVVQRTPDYIDASEEPHLKQSELTSPANQGFGRKFEIVQFRWLASSEV